MRVSKRPALALDTAIVQDNIPQEIVPSIFIGSIHAAFNQDALLEQGITHILNASRIPATFPKHFTYLTIDIRDKEDANILSCIPASNIFIEAGVDSGGVLVHCFGGRSRSAAFVVAFLMSSREWTYEQAIATITRARPVAGVNKGFERQLRAYQGTNYDVYAAQQVLLLSRIRSLHMLRQSNGSELLEANSRSPSPSSESGQKRGYQWDKTLSIEEAADIKEEEEEDDEAQAILLSTESAASISSPRSEPHRLTHSYQFDSFTALPIHKAYQLVHGPSTKSSSSPRVVGAKESPSKANVVAEGPPPNIRLTRPGSSSVRVIPPLRGLERRYCCSWCGCDLFSLASVVRIDLLLGQVERGAVVSSQAQSKQQQELYPVHMPQIKRSSGLEGAHVTEDAGRGYFPDMPPPRGSPKGSPINASEYVRGAMFFPAEEKEAKSVSTLDYIAPAAPKTMRNSDNKGHGGFDFMDVAAGGRQDCELKPESRNPILALPLQLSRPAGECAKDNGCKDDLLVDRTCTTGSTGSTPRASSTTPRDTTPRLLVPSSREHFMSLRAPLAGGGIATCGNQGISAETKINLPRPQSAEKKRWLDRVSLLRSAATSASAGSSGSNGSQLQKIALVAAEDDSASQKVELDGLTGAGGKYLYLEYCQWMGAEPLSGREEDGHINCKECKRAIGLWSWRPSIRQCLDGLLEPPLFRILKDSVAQTPLTLDSTPTSTPRLDLDDSIGRARPASDRASSIGSD